MNSVLHSLLTSVLPWLLSNPGTVATGVVSVLGLVVGSNVVRKRRVAEAIFHAFHITETIAKETPGDDAFDKVAAALKSADDYMKANGWRPLEPGEQMVAGMQLQSLAAQAAAKAPAAASPQ